MKTIDLIASRRVAGWLQALLLCVACFGPVDAGAQDQYYFEMRDRLLRAGAVLVMAGYRLSHEPHVQVYRHDHYRDLSLTLDGQREFALVAVGDDDARNIDLQLYDPQGRLIAQDLGPSNVAMVQVNTRVVARWTLRVIMRECATQDCYAGVGVFMRVR